MSFDITQLNSALTIKLTNLIQNCSNHGYTFVPYFGLRTLQQQAIMWRQSRTNAVIQQQLLDWRSLGACYLADILDGVGQQNGPMVTNALPGFSWHNWGEAVDCYLEIDGKPCWDGDNPGYKVYAEEAVKLGLTAGYYFKSFKDPGHIQLRSQEIPKIYSLQEVNDNFKKKYENLEA